MKVKPPNYEIVDIFNDFIIGLRFPHKIQFDPGMSQRHYEAILWLTSAWESMEVQVRELALKQPKLF